MKIGSVKLDNITIMAPLAGITNLPFRLLAKEAGAALVCSEMVSANGLVYKSQKTEQLLDSLPAEKPLSVQIFGSDPDIMAEAARMVESVGADMIDINFGCSVKKVLKTGSGAALMKDPDKAAAIITALRQSVKIPVTIKIRSGWNKSGKDALKIAEIAQESGVDAITVHPRTATQGFGGYANWQVIADIEKNISIPVIGNGDIVHPDDALQMLKETGCDAVMIGRAAIGHPLIFKQILALLRGDRCDINLVHRFAVMVKYLKNSVEYFGEKHACRMMRSRLCWFVKGLPGSGRFRKSINRISSEGEALGLIKSYIKVLQDDRSI
ncbi:MAG: tRNA dihydrouridine synthase DusB [Deltaproteobacteria bacterium]|nr:tRNA dihydrouridine synthase DusB [Deltaproteobacteria bacterium]